VSAGAGVCRECGCTENEACVFDRLGRLVDLFTGQTLPPGWTVCSWVEYDLCSGCVETPAPPPLLYDAQGRPLRGAP
jgi:hypothetical protein